MTPEKFRHAGLDWIPHTPGDPMPCQTDTLVRVLFRNKIRSISVWAAKEWCWDKCGSASIIGWHPIEEQPTMASKLDNLIELWESAHCDAPETQMLVNGFIQQLKELKEETE